MTEGSAYLAGLEMSVMASWRKRSLRRLYREDPEAWLADVLGYRWHNKQREIVENFLNNRRVATKSANGTGKTRIYGELATWGIDTHEPGELFIIASSPSATQLKDGLFGYIDKNLARARSRGHDMIGYLTDTPTWAYRATTTSKAKTLMRGRTPPRQDIVGTFQGIRAIADEDVATWVLIDEGGAVHDDLFVAAEAVTTGAGESKIGVIGNPDKIGTYFQKIFEDEEIAQDWATTTISAYDLPTFTGEIVYSDEKMQNQMLNSGMIDFEWVEQKKRAWGEESARYRSKVLGEFPDSDDFSFFSQTAINRGEDTKVVPDGEGRNILGVDLADSEGAGDDSKAYINLEGAVEPDPDDAAKESSLLDKRGCRIRHIDTWNEGVQSEARIHEAALKTDAQVVVIDALGVGAGPFHRVMNRPDRYYTVVGIKGSWASPDPSRWANYRAFMYDQFREGLLNGEIDLEYKEEIAGTGQRIGKALRDQLLSIRYELTDKGAIQIEPKRKARLRGISSPDDLDAVINAYHERTQRIAEDPLGSMTPGDTVLYDPFELEEIGLAGMPI